MLTKSGLVHWQQPTGCCNKDYVVCTAWVTCSLCNVCKWCHIQCDTTPAILIWGHCHIWGTVFWVWRESLREISHYHCISTVKSMLLKTLSHLCSNITTTNPDLYCWISVFGLVAVHYEFKVQYHVSVYPWLQSIHIAWIMCDCISFIVCHVACWPAHSMSLFLLC